MQLSLILAALPVALAAPAMKKRAEPAPLITPRGADIIPEKYIVKFKADSEFSILDDAISALSSEAEHVYRDMFKGFATTLDKDALARLRDHPQVEYIEKDGISRIAGVTAQRSATWGLSRLSNNRPGASVYSYDESAGEGTCAYVIDTGVDDTHPDFNGRAKQLTSFVNGENTDGNGHGTHVAGTIGSTTYGVAKKTRIYGVKVLGNSGAGSNSAIISGMEYVAKDKEKRECPKGVVANMSLGGQRSSAINQAAAALVQSGVFLGVAAGNDNQDASNFSPASEQSVCTVGGTASDDSKYQMSNWGSPVNILAPGVNILSTRAGGGTTTLTGTSMATPHIVGLAAYLGALEGLKGTEALCRRMQELAIKDVISNQPQGTVNLLASNGAGKGNHSDPGTPGPEPEKPSPRPGKPSKPGKPSRPGNPSRPGRPSPPGGPSPPAFPPGPGGPPGSGFPPGPGGPPGSGFPPGPGGPPGGGFPPGPGGPPGSGFPPGAGGPPGSGFPPSPGGPPGGGFPPGPGGPPMMPGLPWWNM